VFSIPEDDLPDIMPQYTAGTPLQVTAFDRANVRALAVGKVAAVDNQIDTTTGTVKVRAQFDNADNVLFPNQFVNVQLLVKTLNNVVTVPTAAIQRGSPGNYVYLINADSTVSVRNITVGPTDTTGANSNSVTAIDSGLAAGDKVVIDGADRLRDGLKVNVVSDTGAQNPAGANAPAGGGGARRGGAGGQGGGAPGGQNPGRAQNQRPSGQ
jgi:membrane fusion protein, multidrug efflux system